MLFDLGAKGSNISPTASGFQTNWFRSLGHAFLKAFVHSWTNSSMPSSEPIIEAVNDIVNEEKNDEAISAGFDKQSRSSLVAMKSAC